MPDFGKLFAGDAGEHGPPSATRCTRPWARRSSRCRWASAAMEIFGSYIGKERSLTGEALRICGLDTAVAIIAGPHHLPRLLRLRGAARPAAPALVFVTLPSVFNQMPLGQLWGALFFVFMSFAALSTIIAVFENIISLLHGQVGLVAQDGRARVNGRAHRACSACPALLGFNVLAGVHDSGHRRHPVHRGLHRVATTCCPWAACVYLLFCVSQRRLGLGQLPGRGRHRQGHEASRAGRRCWLKFGHALR